MNRLYLPVTLCPNQDFVWPEAAHHYLAHVMRARVGDALEVFDGITGSYIARITPPPQGPHYLWVGEGGNIPKIGLPSGDFSQDAAHDFARAGFGQAITKLDMIGLGDGADIGFDVINQLVFQGR